MLDLLFTRRGRALAAPTGMIVLLAVGFALMDAGDHLDGQASMEGGDVAQGASATVRWAAYGVAGVGVVGLLAGGAFAVSMLREEEDEDEVPVHRGGPPPPTGGGIEI